jgi:hypothetical protein
MPHAQERDANAPGKFLASRTGKLAASIERPRMSGTVSLHGHAEGLSSPGSRVSTRANIPARGRELRGHDGIEGFRFFSKKFDCMPSQKPG